MRIARQRAGRIVSGALVVLLCGGAWAELSTLEAQRESPPAPALSILENSAAPPATSGAPLPVKGSPYTLAVTPQISARYAVRRGDTLAVLARRWGIPLQTLVRVNGLRNPHRLSTGQQLFMPLRASAAPVASAPTPARAYSARQLIAERTRLVKERAAPAGQQLVQAAQQFAGTPYSWGGLSSRGLDCSGLVVRAMRLQGRQVPHNAAALYQLGRLVPTRDLQPGDLVFFNTNGQGISHVGIWMGANRFIHASSSRRGVVVDALAGYYEHRLVGARRIN